MMNLPLLYWASQETGNDRFREIATRHADTTLKCFVLLPHLKDRALTLKRYPNGVEGEFFYEQRCPSFRPSWVKTAPVWSETNQRTVSYCLANDLPSLVWAANLADLELHTSLARHQKLGRPAMMVFDLDPGLGADIIDCCEVAVWLRDFLAEQKLKCFPKTSGSKGMQVYVPLNTAVTFDQTKHFARALAENLAGQHPAKVVSQMAKRLRPGKTSLIGARMITTKPPSVFIHCAPRRARRSRHHWNGMRCRRRSSPALLRGSRLRPRKC